MIGNKEEVYLSVILMNSRNLFAFVVLFIISIYDDGISHYNPIKMKWISKWVYIAIRLRDDRFVEINTFVICGFAAHQHWPNFNWHSCACIFLSFSRVSFIFRYRQTRFSSRRVRKRVVFKHGDCNVVQGNVAKRRRKYLQVNLS